MSRTKTNPRFAVAEALTSWGDKNAEIYAHEVFERTLEGFELTPLDRGLANNLFLGCLRNLTYLDHVIAHLRKRGSLKKPVRNLLRLGIYQIFKTEIADHAAVNETVSLAKKHERGIVNAILRNGTRQKEEIINLSESWSSDAQLSHPKFLITRWQEAFGKEIAAELCEWNNTPPDVYARIHDEEAYEKARAAFKPEHLTRSTDSVYPVKWPEPVEDFPEFIQLPAGPPPQEWIDQGMIYIQDPSTSVAPWLLAPLPGETILDACAAPGGKTAMLWSMSPEGSRIIASDSNPTRIERMKENFQRLQIEDIEVRQIDWMNPSEEETRGLPKFDAILLDVPCSNTGVMRRRVDVRWRLRHKDFSELGELQLKILKEVIPFLKPEGRIVYSTCSIDPEENRRLVEASGLEIEEIRETLPWRNGVDGSFAARLRLPRSTE